MAGRFARDVFGIASATALSRALGLVREVAIANQFGASAAYDAYLIAFFVPHFLRRLVAEGALSTAFIPLYTQRLKRNPEDADAFASAVLSLGLIAFPLLILLGVALAPWYVPFLADGFDPAQLALTVHLSRITFPFIGLIGVAALAMGVLNAHGRFVVPALAPVAFNLAMIAAVLTLEGWGAESLAVGVLLGGGAQLAAQLPSLQGRFRFRWNPDWHDPGVKELLTLLLPAVVGLAVVQVNVLVDYKLASRLPAGGISALQYAIRLFQLPFGLFAVAVSTAILPRLSARAAAGIDATVPALRRGVQACAAILIPAAVGLWALGDPIVRLLFEHGAFTPADTARTAGALGFYVLGLFPYGVVTVLSRAFYALKDGRTPVAVSAVAVAVNVALSLALVGPLGVDGLALATGVAGWVQLGAAWWALQRRTGPPLLDAAAGRALARVGLAAAAMGGGARGLLSLLGPDANEVAAAILPMGAGVALYGALIWPLARSLAGEEPAA